MSLFDLVPPRAVLVATILVTGFLVPTIAAAAVDTSVYANVAGSPGQEDSGGPTLSVSAFDSDGTSAFAALDLAAGTLRARATSLLTGGGVGQARFTDTITVTGPLTGVIHGTVSMHVTGQIVPDLAGAVPALTSGVAFLRTGFEGVGIQTVYFAASCAGIAGFSLECLEGTSFDHVFRVGFTISPETRTGTISAGLDAFAQQSGQANFTNTAHLSIELPDGFAFTSESGVLLTAIPEPETWALMAAGLLLLGFTWRRRHVACADCERAE